MSEANEEQDTPQESFSVEEASKEFKTAFSESRVVFKKTSQIGTYLISGKPVEEWEQEFNLRIPPSPSIKDIVPIISRADQLFHRCQFKLNEAMIYKSVIENQYKQLYNKQLLAAKRIKKFKNAQESQAYVKDKLTDYKNQIVLADIELQFWEGVKSKLISSKTLLNSAVTALNAESRVNGNYNSYSQ